MPLRPSWSLLICSQFGAPGRACRPRLAEHVRMATDQLGRDRPRRRRPVALAPLRQQQRQEGGLKQQVAELVQQLLRVAQLRRLGHLVGLLQRVWHDRKRRLLPVPGAVAAQPGGQPHQRDHGVARHQRRQRVAVRHGWHVRRGRLQPHEPLARGRRHGRIAGQRQPLPAQPPCQRLVRLDAHRPGRLQRPEGRKRDQFWVTRAERNEELQPAHAARATYRRRWMRSVPACTPGAYVVSFFCSASSDWILFCSFGVSCDCSSCDRIWVFARRRISAGCP